MIIYKEDNIFNSDTQVLVNTINCDGVMGKGLALEFKLRYPEMFEDYKQKCSKSLVKIGEPYLFKAKDKWILNFPTKYHWRNPSKIEYIDKGLRYFSQNYKKWGIKSISFPRLGCTTGGLDWQNVKVLIEKYLSNLDIDVYIYLDNPHQIINKEKELLDKINIASLEELISNYRIKKNFAKKIVQQIKTYGSIKRLRDLRTIKGIGEKTYQKLINLRKEDKESKEIQLDIFK